MEPHTFLLTLLLCFNGYLHAQSNNNKALQTVHNTLYQIADTPVFDYEKQTNEFALYVVGLKWSHAGTPTLTRVLLNDGKTILHDTTLFLPLLTAGIDWQQLIGQPLAPQDVVYVPMIINYKYKGDRRITTDALPTAFAMFHQLMAQTSKGKCYMLAPAIHHVFKPIQ